MEFLEDHSNKIKTFGRNGYWVRAVVFGPEEIIGAAIF